MKLFVADNHDVIRRGLRLLLTERPGWTVCGEAKNGRDAVKYILELKPEIAILAFDLPEFNGVEVTRRIKEAQAATEVLFFTRHDEDHVIADALRAGARAYVLKSDDEEKIIEAVEALTKHLPYFTTRASEMLLNHLIYDDAQSAQFVLSDREREIVQLLASGRSNKEAASLLRISAKTVETHRAAIMRKLGMKSITEMVRYAIRIKLIEP